MNAPLPFAKIGVCAVSVLALFAASPALATDPGGANIGVSGSGSGQTLSVQDAPGGSFVPFATVDGTGHKVRATPSFLDGVPIGATTPAAASVTVLTQTGKGAATISGALSNVGDAYGFDRSVTNTGTLAGHGDAFRCFTHANAGAFELCRSAIMFDMPTTVPTNTQYQSFWNVNVSPTDITHTWGATNGELNVTNRGDDGGWTADVTAVPRFTGGLRFIPESQNFGVPDGSSNWGDNQGTAKNVTFGFTVGHSSLHNAAGKLIETYAPFLVEPDAIGPGGRAFFATGDTQGLATNQKPYAPLGVAGSWQGGLDLSGASFVNGVALAMGSGHALNWSNGNGTASLQGACSGATCNLYATTPAIIPTGATSLGSTSQPFSNFYLAPGGAAVLPFSTPASSSAACVQGQVTDDASYHYVCTATNTWKRVALTTF